MVNSVDPLGGSYLVESLTDQMEEKIWELMKVIEDKGGFIQCFKHDADDLSLIKAEGSVIGSADQVVRQFCLDDTQRTSHALR